MSTERIQTTLISILQLLASAGNKQRLVIAATLDTPIGDLRALLDRLSSKNHYELHLVGPDETIQAMGDVATLHQAYLPEEIDQTLANLFTSGGVDLGLLLPDPRRPEPSAVTRVAAAFDSPLYGFSLLCPEKLERPVLLGDTLVQDQPGPDELAAVVQASMEVAKKLNVELPKVALLAAVEVASPGLPATMLEAEVAGRFSDSKDGYVHGPLSMDLAVSKLAAEKKKAKGEVPGNADVLIGPTLTVSRGVLHAFRFGCDEPAVTALLGGSVPIAVVERGAAIGQQVLAVQFAESLI